MENVSRNPMTRHALVPGLLCLTLAAGPTMGSGASPAGLQEGKPASVEVDPPELELEVGETIQLRAVVKDAQGTVLPGAQVVFFSGSRSSVGVTPSGMVEAYQPGEHELTALSPAESFEGEPDSYSRRDSGIRTTIKVKVPGAAFGPAGFRRFARDALCRNHGAGRGECNRCERDHPRGH